MVEMTRHQQAVADVALAVLEYKLSQVADLKIVEFTIEVTDIGTLKEKPLVSIYAYSDGNVYVRMYYQMFVFVRGRIDYRQSTYGHEYNKKFYTRIFWHNWREMEMAKQRGEFEPYPVENK